MLDLKYFYEKFIAASGVPKHHFGIRKYIRMNKIKRIYGTERNSTNV
jgi:hypothetical protein